MVAKDFGDCFTNAKLLKIIKDNNIDLKEEYIKILKRNKINLGKQKDIIYGCYTVSELKKIIVDNNIVENKSDLKGMKKKDLVETLKNNGIKLANLPTGKKVREVPQQVINEIVEQVQEIKPPEVIITKEDVVEQIRMSNDQLLNELKEGITKIRKKAIARQIIKNFRNRKQNKPASKKLSKVEEYILNNKDRIEEIKKMKKRNLSILERGKVGSLQRKIKDLEVENESFYEIMRDIDENSKRSASDRRAYEKYFRVIQDNSREIINLTTQLI